MKKLIADNDGVSLMIGEGEVIANLDFNFSRRKLNELDSRGRVWDINLYNNNRVIGSASFRAYQFMADGVERRTIALVFVGIKPRFRGQRLSYNVAQYIIDTVTYECDQVFGPVEGKPVLFIERRDIKDVRDKNVAIEFLRKIGEHALGLKPSQPAMDKDIALAIIGEDISIQLIEGHLERAAPA